MPMQTRSMTTRAGVPHDLEAFNSYAEDTFDSHLPPKKRQRFIGWEEEEDSDDSSFIPSDDEEATQATIVDDDEDSFEAATGSSESDFDPFEPPQLPTYDEVPKEIKATYDPTHFCPSWVKCCEENLATKLAPPRSWIECNNATSGLPASKRSANSVLGPRQHAGGPSSSSSPPPPHALGWSIPSNLQIDTLAPLPRWPVMLATFRTRFTRSQWRDYIGEICHNISYEDPDLSDDSLTTEEYAAARDFMHGKL